MIRSLIGAGAAGLVAVAMGAAVPTPAHADTVLTIATGRVLDASGAPVQGASLDLQAWPNNDVLAAANEGDTVNLVNVASVSTDSNGDFSLALPSVSALADEALGDGIVDFTLTSMLPDGTSSHFSFSRRLVNTSVLGSVIEAVVDPDLSDNVITNLIAGLTSQLVQPLLGLVLTPAGTSTNDPADTTSLDIGDQVPEDQYVPLADNSACSSKVIKDFGNRTTQVNAAAALYSGSTTDFVYSSALIHR